MPKLEEDILHELNAEQKEAVIHQEGPLLIIAGAGTGKTMVITRRIAYLIATKKAKPEEILALTFTDKAAHEMEERVDILVPYGYTDIWISTFHAFGDRVLREYALEIGLDPDFQVLTRPEQIIFLREHLFEFPLSYYCPLGNPTRYLETLLTLFSRARDEDVTPEEYLAYAEKIKKKAEENPENEEIVELAQQQTEIAFTYKKYQELKAKAGRMDFGDQVNLTLMLFRTHPRVLNHFQERFRYILVDEFQDTNYAQFQLVKQLAVRYRNITVVGDDDQSIYKFRGASISNIFGFMDTYPEAKQIVLTKNYRSPQVILDDAYRLIKYNNPERLEVKNNIEKQLVSTVSEGKPIEHLHYDTLSSESDEVAKLIQKLVKTGKYTYKDFAILVRANKGADPFLRALNMEGIPWQFTGTQGLYTRPEIKLLISFLRIIANPSDSLSLYYLATSEIYQLDVLDLTRCMNFARRRNETLYYIFTHLKEFAELKEISLSSQATISEIIEDIKTYLEISRNYSTGEVLYKFVTQKGYLKRLSKLESLSAEEKIQNIAKFFEIIRSSGEVLFEDKVRGFVDYLNMLMEAGDEPAVSEIDLEREAVNVLTVHKAKGLEFRIVFLVSLVSDRFPTRRRGELIFLPESLVKDILPTGDFHLQEERRLFYVGMTRAKERLYFTSARDYGGARLKKISPFVLEALNLPKREPEPFKSQALEVIKRYAPRAESVSKGAKLVFQNRLLTLSYYKIDDYLTCPLKYKYVQILRVPIMQHHTVIYGKALHNAVQEYHRRKVSKQKVTVEDLIKVFEGSWRSEGFLTREHEEKRLKAGRLSLENFFAVQEKSKFSPTYVEKEFKFMIGNNRIIGRWDRIDIRDGKPVIVDFKSSEIQKQKEATKRAKESLQLSLYALAYKEKYGEIPERGELYFLESGLVGIARKTKEDLEKTIEKVKEASSGIQAVNYEAKPSYFACRYCAYQAICPYII